jgi:hypothetical protein
MMKKIFVTPHVKASEAAAAGGTNGSAKSSQQYQMVVCLPSASRVRRTEF